MVANSARANQVLAAGLRDRRALDHSMLGATVARHMQVGPGQLRASIERRQFNALAMRITDFSAAVRATVEPPGDIVTLGFVLRADRAVPDRRTAFRRRHDERVRRRPGVRSSLSGRLLLGDLGHAPRRLRTGAGQLIDARIPETADANPQVQVSGPRYRPAAGGHRLGVWKVWRRTDPGCGSTADGPQMPSVLRRAPSSPAGRSGLDQGWSIRPLACCAHDRARGRGPSGCQPDSAPIDAGAVRGLRTPAARSSGRFTICSASSPRITCACGHANAVRDPCSIASRNPASSPASPSTTASGISAALAILPRAVRRTADRCSAGLAGAIEPRSARVPTAGSIEPCFPARAAGQLQFAGPVGPLHGRAHASKHRDEWHPAASQQYSRRRSAGRFFFASATASRKPRIPGGTRCGARSGRLLCRRARPAWLRRELSTWRERCLHAASPSLAIWSGSSMRWARRAACW